MIWYKCLLGIHYHYFTSCFVNLKIDILCRFCLDTTSIITSRLNKIILNNCESVGFAHWIGAYVMLTIFGGQLSDAIFHAVIKNAPVQQCIIVAVILFQQNMKYLPWLPEKVTFILRLARIASCNKKCSVGLVDLNFISRVVVVQLSCTCKVFRVLRFLSHKN